MESYPLKIHLSSENSTKLNSNLAQSIAVYYWTKVLSEAMRKLDKSQLKFGSDSARGPVLDKNLK